MLFQLKMNDRNLLGIWAQQILRCGLTMAQPGKV